MPLPLIGPKDYYELHHKATGPFSFRMSIVIDYTKGRRIASEFTCYILPDGGWTWHLVPAEKWNPELSGYPPFDLPDFPEVEKSL